MLHGALAYRGDVSYKSILLVQILTQKLKKKKKYDTPPVLHGALAYRGDVTAATVPEAAHRVAYAFLSALTAAGNFFFCMLRAGVSRVTEIMT